MRFTGLLRKSEHSIGHQQAALNVGFIERLRVIYVAHQVEQRLQFLATLDHQHARIWRGMSTPWRLSNFRSDRGIPSAYLLVSNSARSLGLGRLFSINCAAYRP
jgi:hypothetical protein